MSSPRRPVPHLVFTRERRLLPELGPALCAPLSGPVECAPTAVGTLLAASARELALVHPLRSPGVLKLRHLGRDVVLRSCEEALTPSGWRFTLRELSSSREVAQLVWLRGSAPMHCAVLRLGWTRALARALPVDASGQCALLADVVAEAAWTSHAQAAYDARVRTASGALPPWCALGVYEARRYLRIACALREPDPLVRELALDLAMCGDIPPAEICDVARAACAPV